MKKILFFAAIAVCLTLTSFTVTQHGPFPFSSHDVYQDASTFQNACTGEMMDYNGLVNFNVHGVINGNKVSFIAHLNYQGLTAVGENTGVIYRGSGQQNISQTTNFKGAGAYTAVTNIKFVAPGKKNNFIVRMIYHFTINAKGEVTSTIDKADFGSCQ